MKIRVTGYSHTYPIGSSGHFEKIWIEAEFEEKDDIQGNLHFLKNQVEQFHRESNPKGLIATAVTVIDEKPATQAEQIIAQLKTCNDIKTLESYVIIARRYPEIRDAYEKKMMELLQKEVEKESIIVAADNLCKSKKRIIKN